MLKLKCYEDMNIARKYILLLCSFSLLLVLLNVVTGERSEFIYFVAFLLIAYFVYRIVDEIKKIWSSSDEDDSE